MTSLPSVFKIRGFRRFVNSVKDNPSSSFSFSPVEDFPISRRLSVFSSLQERVNEDRVPALFPVPF